MTLIDKFEPYVIRYTQDDVVGYLAEETPIFEYQEQCALIVKEVACDFSEWHIQMLLSSKYTEIKTIGELFEIYKKEKTL
jgi:hypothetical protein